MAALLVIAAVVVLWQWALPALHNGRPGAGTAPVEEPTTTGSMPPTNPPVTTDPPPTADGLRQARCAGLTVQLPAGWQVGAPSGGLCQAAASGTPATFLRFGALAPPPGTVLAYIEAGEQGNPNIQDGYQRLVLRTVSYQNIAEAVDWEFIFRKNGQQRHVIARYWLLDGAMYLIYSSAPAAEWTTAVQVFEAAAGTATAG